MADGAAANEGLADLMHLDGTLHAGMYAELFEGILQGQGVENGGEHTHVVAGSPVNLKTLLSRAAKDISAADHDGDLRAEFVDFAQFLRDGINGFAINAESVRALEGFAGKFQENPVVGRVLFAALLHRFRLRCP